MKVTKETRNPSMIFSTSDMARQHATTLRQMLVNDQLMTLNEGNETNTKLATHL